MKQSLLKALSLLVLFPCIAVAHTGVGETAGLMHGFGHPIGGADHLLAMIAVGLWAVQTGGRALWVVPATFVAVMALGGVLGFSGVPVPFIEVGILSSVLVLGVLIAGAYKLPLAYGALIVGFFAIFHGYAHGAEMPSSTGAISYTVGFAVATAILHTAGIAFGVLAQRIGFEKVNRLAGSAIALGGIYLAIS